MSRKLSSCTRRWRAAASILERSTAAATATGRYRRDTGGALASDTSAKLAVLIDADNASPAVIEGLLAEVAKYGTAHAKRAYGDWTGTSLRGWKEQLLAQYATDRDIEAG
jgi:hypothetical protein